MKATVSNTESAPKYAVIDLGTNTCNLLIAREGEKNHPIDVLYERRVPVKLGRGGIHKDELMPDAIDRGVSALSTYRAIIDSHEVSTIRTIGTSAVRGARNRQTLLDKIYQETGLTVDVIDGELEAQLIFEGVEASIPDHIDNYMIMDIGGGSIEFVFVKGHTIHWKKSFPIGIARALESVPLSDPITEQEIIRLENWFDSQLTDLWDLRSTGIPDHLVGCSGAFDTFMDILYECEVEEDCNHPVQTFEIDKFQTIHHLLLSNNQEARSRIKGMDQMRVEMIVIASILTNFILNKLNIKELIYTHYSLKEGVMLRMINNKQLHDNG